MFGEKFGQQLVSQGNHAGAAYNHKIHTRQIQLGFPEGIPDQTFDSVALYCACGTFTRYRQPQASLVAVVTPAEDDEIAVRRFLSLFEDTLKIRFSAQSRVFSKRCLVFSYIRHDINQ